MHKIHFGTLAMTFPGLIMIVLGRWLGQKLLGVDSFHLWLTEFYLPWQGIAGILMMGWGGILVFRVYPFIRDENSLCITLPLAMNLAAILLLIPLIASGVIFDARDGVIDLVAIGTVLLVALTIPFVASVLAEIYFRLGGYEYHPPER